MTIKPHIRAGWDWVKEHLYIWIILFIYQLLWGFFLYRFIDHIVVPLLQRYPEPAPTELSRALFHIEAHFQLTKTTEYAPYLWTLVGFVALRMLFTPLIHAGLLYSMSYSQRNSKGLAFFRGMKTLWKSMSLLYIFEMIIVLLPAYWIVPKLTVLLQSAMSATELLQNAAPLLVLWLVGGWIVHHLFLFMQFGKASEQTIGSALVTGVRGLLPILGISLLFLVIGFLGSALVTAAAMFWTGMTALLLQQAYPAIRTLLQIWSLSSRFDVWQKIDNRPF
ncbi:carbamoyl transferase [Paenibacillus assamensis]|uniref:carbamoyl transferase n=1 Tax=Paenibacillus assamensis TaxID=311244 RepID=UPI000414EA9E|nr:carbamoyl transferase [Paenibacillus assamensis]